MQYDIFIGETKVGVIESRCILDKVADADRNEIISRLPDLELSDQKLAEFCGRRSDDSDTSSDASERKNGKVSRIPQPAPRRAGTLGSG